MTASTIAASITKLNADQCNDLLDVCAAVFNETDDSFKFTKQAAKQIAKEIRSKGEDFAVEISTALREQWGTCQKSLVAKFAEGDSVTVMGPHGVMMGGKVVVEDGRSLARRIIMVDATDGEEYLVYPSLILSHTVKA